MGFVFGLQAFPAILEIPSKEHPYDPNKDSILQRVKLMVSGPTPLGLSPGAGFTEAENACASPDCLWILPVSKELNFPVRVN